MKIKILLSLTCCLLSLSTAAGLLRADHTADLRNEVIPPDGIMTPPLHIYTGIAPDVSGPTGYTPQQLRHAYGFDRLNTTGSGQTIAIIDAYGSTTIQADLDTFCAAVAIPSTTVQVYYPQGTPPTDPDYPGWAVETSLDVEWSHAIAPGAKIVLVAAKSDLISDLLTAVDYAVSLGATQVSMSFGGSEYPTETSSDFHFNVPGVTFFASSGDSGSGAQYPAASPYVVSVGGTTLTLDSSGNYISETGWSGSGGGPSAYETEPSYQAGWWSGPGRGIPDVAYDADLNTGVPVYQSSAGWLQVGGTSMSAPQWAALSALANSLNPQSVGSTPGIFYSLAVSSSSPDYAAYFHDITSGSNGMYAAGPGYDLVTGLGTPIANQLVIALAGGFFSQAVAPVFFPGAGTYAGAQKVTIVSATSGVSIRYTTDGSTPSNTHGTLYTSPVTIGANATLKAIAYQNGFTTSPVTSGGYTFISQAAAPTFSPAAGNFTYAQTVAISTTTSGASIRYTTDGSTPTETYGTLYSGPVLTDVLGTTVINAIAYKSGLIDSVITDGDYTSNSYNVLYQYSGTNNGGIFPVTGLIEGSDGNFYGTTDVGGTSNDGTIYKMTPTGAVTFLASFNGTNGAQPSSLIQGTDGNFYGTTLGTGNASGFGTTFKMTPSGTLTLLVAFNPTSGLPSNLVQGPDGNFYGLIGDTSSTHGFVFKMTPAGILTTLFSFNGTDGDSPDNMILGSDGNFYGTTGGGGSNNDGTVFKLTPAGALTTLFAFNGTNGTSPSSLIQGFDGNFYGVTGSGAANDSGTFFKLTPSGAMTTLVTFDSSEYQGYPGDLVQGIDGNFYGTFTNDGDLYGDGSLFQITPSGNFTTILLFGIDTGANPQGQLLRGNDGNIYGTNTDEGTDYGNGTIFELLFPPRTLTGSSGNGFHSLAFTSAQRGTFTATFDATPTVSPENSVVGLSKGAVTAYTGFSCIARFNPSGDIDAYNKTGYAAASKIPYSAKATYHFRLVVNVSANTYSVYVTPPGGSEKTVGLNYGFRTKQTSLDTWNLEVDSTPAKCALTASNLNP
jgi:uncharacterized repeat protein (TIGR03803 family)